TPQPSSPPTPANSPNIVLKSAPSLRTTPTTQANCNLKYTPHHAPATRHDTRKNIIHSPVRPGRRHATETQKNRANNRVAINANAPPHRRLQQPRLQLQHLQ